jgi:hypothetical protein
VYGVLPRIAPLAVPGEISRFARRIGFIDFAVYLYVSGSRPNWYRRNTKNVQHARRDRTDGSHQPNASVSSKPFFSFDFAHLNSFSNASAKEVGTRTSTESSFCA